MHQQLMKPFSPEVEEQYQPRIIDAYQISEKMVRYNALSEIRSDAIPMCAGGPEGENAEAVGELFVVEKASSMTG